jgi:hypothetical protein
MVSGKANAACTRRFRPVIWLCAAALPWLLIVMWWSR